MSNGSVNAAELSLERLRRAAESVGRATGCRLVVLFGSVARRERRPADIDLGVVCDRGPDPVALTNRFIRALDTQEVDVTDLRRADPLIMMLAARDGTPLHEDPAGEFARFASLAARRYADTRKFRRMEREEIRDFVARTEGARTERRRRERGS